MTGRAIAPIAPGSYCANCLAAKSCQMRDSSVACADEMESRIRQHIVRAKDAIFKLMWFLFILLIGAQIGLAFGGAEILRSIWVG